MKIVNIIGGLGNQMFQYALYLALCKKYPAEEVKIYKAAYEGYGLHNSYELANVFGVYAPEATSKEVGRMGYPFKNYRQWQITNHLFPKRCRMFKDTIFGHYYSEVFNQDGDCYYDGYWQNERYLKDIRETLLQTFEPLSVDNKNAEVAQRLTSSASVSIHVRHGDFLKKKIYKGICGLDYYERAIEEITSKTDVEVFCLFSNDITWCKENIIPLLKGKDYIIADWNTGSKSYLDMYLMSQCRHNIIAHSSFSWWGAWLNQHPDKTVIGPKVWINMKKSEFELPDEWIKL